MERDRIEILRETCTQDVFRFSLIHNFIDSYLEKHPLDPKTFDVDSEAIVLDACYIISKQVREEYVSCSEKDVLLQWLIKVLMDKVVYP